MVQLSETADPVFSSGAMGAGVAVSPAEETVFSPVSGTVLSAMPHAVGILADDGSEVLVHVGIDTVEMAGDGLTCHVQQDARVTAGDPIVTFSKAKVAAWMERSRPKRIRNADNRAVIRNTDIQHSALAVVQKGADLSLQLFIEFFFQLYAIAFL